MKINLGIMTKDQLKKFIVELEKENKNLRDYAYNLDSENDNQTIEIEELKKENQTLKDNVEFLHSCLDDRDKSIAIMQEENDKLKIHIEAKDKAYESLLTDYNYLQARIKRMEKKFLEYVENHKKLEDELDDVIMNR